MGNSNPNSFLNQYVSERLPQIAPGIFDNVEDQPHFTVDQRYIPPGNKTTTV